MADFHFDPTFALLPKFSMGFRPVPTTEAEIQLVSNYLGVQLPAGTLDQKTKILSMELEDQNRFLTRNLELDSIDSSDDFRRSKFIQDIVANSRESRAKRLASKDGA